MLKKKVYIAASWKHEHAVRMLTDLLRDIGLEVLSFVENKLGKQDGYEALTPGGVKIDFDEWVYSERGEDSFYFDTNGATTADLVIYIGPSGTDAWAEVGAAWGAGQTIIGLWAKGEPAGLMRRMMVAWYTDHRTMLAAIKEMWSAEIGESNMKTIHLAVDTRDEGVDVIGAFSTREKAETYTDLFNISGIGVPDIMDVDIDTPDLLNARRGVEVSLHTHSRTGLPSWHARQVVLSGNGICIVSDAVDSGFSYVIVAADTKAEALAMVVKIINEGHAKLSDEELGKREKSVTVADAISAGI